MRVELDRPSVTVVPGQPAELAVDVYNTDGIIDGVTASVLGLDPAWVTPSTDQLALFPDSSGSLVLRLTPPLEYPAGNHRLTVQLTSVVTGDSALVDFELVVPALVDGAISMLPAAASGHRRGEFMVLLENTGNVPVELALSASDPERSLRYNFMAPAVAAGPGGSSSTTMRVKGPRHLFGAELARAITVAAAAPDLEVSTHAVFRQKPRVPRG